MTDFQSRLWAALALFGLKKVTISPWGAQPLAHVLVLEVVRHD